MIQASAALNVCQYLMIKADHASSAMDEETNGDNILDIQEEDNIKNHPVIQRLNQLNQLSEKLEVKIESKVHGLDNQVESLVKASELMKGLSGDGDDDDESEDSRSHGHETDDSLQDQQKDMQDASKDNRSGSDETEVSDDDDEDDDGTASSLLEDKEEDTMLQKRLMNEARFALRKQDVEETRDGDSDNIRGRRRVLPTYSDFGDDDDANEEEIKAAGKTLASTINRISQRSKTTKSSSFAPEENDALDDEGRFRRGIEMMEAELGDDDDLNDVELDADSLDDDEDNFYTRIKKKSQAKKEFKKSLYAVAPKYPVIDEEIAGERAIGSTILKNRGLVAHKSKLNRNPRVKKREQYRKALIKRKGAVREVRTDEGHKYGGETTGIKAGLSRSRKLGVK